MAQPLSIEDVYGQKPAPTPQPKPQAKAPLSLEDVYGAAPAPTPAPAPVATAAPVKKPLSVADVYAQARPAARTTPVATPAPKPQTVASNGFRATLDYNQTIPEAAGIAKAREVSPMDRQAKATETWRGLESRYVAEAQRDPKFLDLTDDLKADRLGISPQDVRLYESTGTPEAASTAAGYRDTIANVPTNVGRNVVGGVAAAGMDLLSLAQRPGDLITTPPEGQPRAADDLNRQAQALQAGTASASEGSILPGIVNRGVFGAARSIPKAIAGGGPVGAIGLFATDAYNQALTTGREAGLSGLDLQKYAAQQGAIEGVVTGVFQRLGAGGLESLSRPAREAFRQSLAAGLGSAGKQLVGELAEEEIIAVGNAVTDKLHGVNPDALDPAQLGSAMADTAVATLITMGAVQGPQAGLGALDGRQRAARLRQLVDERAKRAPVRTHDIIKDAVENGAEDALEGVDLIPGAAQQQAPASSPSPQRTVPQPPTAPAPEAVAPGSMADPSGRVVGGLQDQAQAELQAAQLQRFRDRIENPDRQARTQGYSMEGSLDPRGLLDRARQNTQQADAVRERFTNPNPEGYDTRGSLSIEDVYRQAPLDRTQRFGNTEPVGYEDMARQADPLLPMPTAMQAPPVELEAPQQPQQPQYADTPRMRKLIAQAQQIESSLPPVPEGHTRLWRGERPGADDSGNPSYTNSLPGIALPFQEMYGGGLRYVDVPNADAQRYLQVGGGVAAGAEFMLPPEVVQRSQRAQPASSVPATQQAEESSPDPVIESLGNIVEQLGESGVANYDKVLSAWGRIRRQGGAMGSSERGILDAPDRNYTPEAMRKDMKLIADAAKRAGMGSVPQLEQQAPAPSLPQPQNVEPVQAPAGGAEKSDFSTVRLKTPSATIRRRDGLEHGFTIETKDGARLHAYTRNRDMPGQADDPTAGELFMIDVPENSRRKGVGASLARDALNTMREAGAKTVIYRNPSKAGAAFRDALIERGLISPAIETAETGTTKHRILVAAQAPVAAQTKTQAPQGWTLEGEAQGASYFRSPDGREIARRGSDGIMRFESTAAGWDNLGKQLKLGAQGQKRAAPGGEIGPNGEFYSGGAFIATTELPKMARASRDKAAKGTVEVEPFKREVPPPGKLAIYTALAPGVTLNPRDMSLNTQVMDNQQLSPGERQRYDDLLRRFKAGERYVDAAEFPEFTTYNDLARMAVAGTPIPGAAIERMARLRNTTPEELQKSLGVRKAGAKNTPTPSTPSPAPEKQERAKSQAWENSDLATKPNIPVERTRAVKQSDGRYTLTFQGASAEVFPGERFTSPAEAKGFFKAQQQKALAAQQGSPAPENVAPGVETAGVESPAPATPDLQSLPRPKLLGMMKQRGLKPTKNTSKEEAIKALGEVEARRGRRMSNEGRPLDNAGVKGGDTFRTSSGRQTTPYPAYSLATDRGASAQERSSNQWLIDNAVAEAEARGDTFNAPRFKSETAKNLPPASKDSMTEYLFGEQPPVLPSMFKELRAPVPTPAAQAQPQPAPFHVVDASGTKVSEHLTRSAAEGAITRAGKPGLKVREAQAAQAPAPTTSTLPKQKPLKRTAIRDIVAEEFPELAIGSNKMTDTYGMSEEQRVSMRTERMEMEEPDRDYARHMAKAFVMEKRGELDKREIGKLVSLDAKDLQPGDVYQLNGDDVTVEAKDEQAVTIEMDGQRYHIPLDKALPANVDSLKRGEAQQTEAAPEPEPTPEPTAAPEPVAEKPAARTGPYTLEEHGEVSKRIQRGEMPADEIRQTYARFKASEESLRAELNAKTIKQLAPRGVRSGTTKREVVESILSNIRHRFFLDKPVSYVLAGDMRAARINAEDAIVAGLTDEETKAFAEKLAKQRAELEQWYNDPQNLPQFELFIRSRGMDKLTPEQKRKYDELVAEQNRTRAERDAANKATVTRVEGAKDTPMSLVEGFHTKRQEKTFIVTMGTRVDNATFKELAIKARRLGGNYAKNSRYTNDPDGFNFKTKEAAEKFMALREQSIDGKERVAEKQEAREESAAERLTAVADRLEEAANETIEADRKTNTARRANMAEGIEARARGDIRTAKTMRNLAGAIASGDATHLNGVSAKTHVELLDSLASRAKHEADRVLKRPYNEEHRNKPATLEDIDHAKYPWPYVRKSSVLALTTIGLKTPGAKRIAAKWRARAQKADETLDVQSAAEVDELRELLAAIKGREGGEKYTAESLAGELADHYRLQKMGIPDLPTLRAALREFMQYKGVAPKADPIKAMERALIGKPLPGFFPTPKTLAGRMIDEADIKPGMKVLEPSAGKGDIADLIREQHDDADLSVIEYSDTLRDILKAKGYEAVGGDFLEHSGTYDRIVMNPPFENGQDIEHVRHAYNLLKPGGRVVAIMSEGPFFRQDKKATAFREWLEEQGGVSEQLPEGSFKGSEAFRETGTATRIVTISKDAEPEAKAGSAARHTITTDALLTPARAIPSAATGRSPSSVWYWQGDPGTITFNAKVRVGGQGPAADAVTLYEQVRKANAAGYKFRNYRAGRLGTVWVLQKGDDILTRGGLDAIGSGVTARPEVPEREADGWFGPRMEAYAQGFAKWLDTLPNGRNSDAGTISRALNSSGIEWVTAQQSATGGYYINFLDENGKGDLRLHAETMTELYQLAVAVAERGYRSATSTKAAPTLADKLSAVEGAARDRLANRTLPGAGRNKGGTTLGGDIVDAAIIIAARSARHVIRNTKDLAGFVKRQLKDVAPHLEADWAKVFQQVRKFRKIAEADSGYFKTEKLEAEIARLRKPVKPKRTDGAVTMKEQIADVSGQTATKESKTRTVTEKQALKASMQAFAKGERQGYKAGHKEALTKIRQQMKDKAASEQAIRAQLVKWVNTYVPTQMRGTMLSQASKAATMRDLRRAITRIRDLRARHLLRMKLAQGKHTAARKALLKLSYENNQKGRPLVDRAEALAKEAKNRKLTTDQRLDLAERIDAVVAEIEALQEQDAAERFENIVRPRIHEKREHKAAVLETLEKEPDLDAKRDDDPDTDREAGIGRRYGRSNLAPDLMFDDLSPKLRKVAVDAAQDGETKVHESDREDQEALEKVLTNQGVTAAETRKWSRHLSSDYTLHEIKLESGQTLKATPEEVIDLIATTRDQQTRKQMLGRRREDGEWARKPRSFTLDAAKRGQRYTLSESDIAALESIDPRYSPIADAIAQQMRKKARALYTVSYRLRGRGIELSDTYYNRSVNSEQAANQGMPDGFTPNLLPEGMGAVTRQMLENLGFFQDRQSNASAPLNIEGAFSRFSRYTHDTNLAIHMAETVRRVSMVTEDRDVKNAIARKRGESQIKRLKWYTAEISGTARIGDTQADKFARAITRNVASAYVTANPKSWGKTLVGGTFSLLAEFDAKHWSAGLKRIKDGSINQKLIDGNGYFWHRHVSEPDRVFTVMGNERGGSIAPMPLNLRDAVERAWADVKKVRFESKGTKTRVLNDLREIVALLRVMTHMDKIVSRVAYGAAEAEVREAHPDWSDERVEKAAIKRAEKAFRLTQNGSSPTETSGLQSIMRRSAIGQFYNVFRSEPGKQLNYIVRGARRGGPAARRAAFAAGANATSSAFIDALLTTGSIAVAFSLLSGNEPPEDELEKTYERGALSFVRNTVGLFPFADIAADATISYFRGREVSEAIMPIPVQAASRFGEGALEVLGAAGHLFTGDEYQSGPNAGRSKSGVMAGRGAEKMLTSALTVTGIPASPIYSQLKALFNGYRTDRDAPISNLDRLEDTFRERAEALKEAGEREHPADARARQMLAKAQRVANRLVKDANQSGDDADRDKARDLSKRALAAVEKNDVAEIVRLSVELRVLEKRLKLEAAVAD